MKRLLLTFIYCSSLFLSPTNSFAIDSAVSVSLNTPAAKKYGPIHSSESLWSVSKKLRPNKSVSIQQTLIAIYKINPNAFTDGDINQLIEHSLINVPSDEFIKTQSNQEAINLINNSLVKEKTPASKVAAAKNATDVITKPRVISEQKTVTLETIDSRNAAVIDIGEQSLTAALIHKKYLPDPQSQGNHRSVTAESENDKANDLHNALSQETEYESLIKMQALQAELSMVNEQLVATTKINQEFKAKLQLLIAEIDLLMNKMDSENAAQLNLLQLIEQYQPEQVSASLQPIVLNSVAGEDQKWPWLTGSLTHLLLLVGLSLLLITCIFWFLLRRRTQLFLSTNRKRRRAASASCIASQHPGNSNAHSLSNTIKDINHINSDIPKENLSSAVMTDKGPVSRSKVTTQRNELTDFNSVVIASASLLAAELDDNLLAVNAEGELMPVKTLDSAPLHYSEK